MLNNTCKGKKEHHEEFGRTKFVTGKCEGNDKISKQRDDNDIESKGEKKLENRVFFIFQNNNLQNAG